MNTSVNKNYFLGLDGFRAVLTLFAFIYHVEMVKAVVGISNAYDFFVRTNFGELTITGFFVLSGFLITYLLLKERRDHGKIEVLKFYKRRALRIWPLYYLYLFIAVIFFWGNDFFSFPWPQFSYMNHSALKIMILHFIGMPNIAYLIVLIPFLSHTWTIGVEEQFYLIWPVILRYSKRMIRFSTYLILALLFIKSGYHYFKGYISDPSVRFWADLIDKYLYYFRIECMAAAGIVAYLFLNNKYNSLIYSVKFQLVCFASIIGMHICSYFFHYVSNTLYAFLLSCLAMNIAGDKSILSFDNQYLAYLGKISYGFYIAHMAIISSVSKLVQSCFLESSLILKNILIYGVSFALTLGAGALSYRYFETPFLKMKGRFE